MGNLFISGIVCGHLFQNRLETVVFGGNDLFPIDFPQKLVQAGKGIQRMRHRLTEKGFNQFRAVGQIYDVRGGKILGQTSRGYGLASSVSRGGKEDCKPSYR